jgi:DnaK suppressor protein
MKELRRRLERERQAAAARLRQLGGQITLEEVATPADSVWDEADHIQASEQREMGLMSRERLVAHIERLTAALKRMDEGTYGTCESCGCRIADERLAAMPATRFCLDCQATAEREARVAGSS